MTASEGIRYRKLPGRRRGLIHGASVWLAPDHLLAVRSYRFREEYKRFYFRDVQAIVVADTPRYHISSRMILAAVLWLIAYAILNSRPWSEVVFGTGAALAFVVWMYVSSAASCRCRIHTAVSRDELPSLYRRRTAQKFLARVDPLIGQTQGVLEGNWAEAVQARAAAQPAASAALDAPQSSRATRTWATDLLIAALFASAIVNVLLLRGSTRSLQWLANGCNLAEVSAAAVIFIQHYRGRLRTAMQRLAIAALVVTGLVLYMQPLTAGVISGINAGRNQRTVLEMDELGAVRGPVIFRQIQIGADVLLGCIGLALVLSADDPT